MCPQRSLCYNDNFEGFMVADTARPPLVLGVETSCDETGLALFGMREHGEVPRIIGEVLHSQIALHARYGGVVPELASRDHVRRLVPLFDTLLTNAQVQKHDISAIAYTEGPGLIGALMTGALFARALAYGLGVPALGVHHMEGHLLAPLIDGGVDYPFVCLLVSGGHSQIVLCEGHGCYRLLGQSIDDAVGECFDKTAKLLGLPYPGGAHIEALAKNGAPIYDLPRPMAHKGLDFSFSGLKTAVHNLIKDNPNAHKADIAASFQMAVVDVLAIKCKRALAQTGLSTLVVAGGVSANQALRAHLQKTLQACVHYAPIPLCTDNGTMIAHAGYLRLIKGQSSDLAVACRPRWDLQSLCLP